jgi:hypothetical protein
MRGGRRERYDRTVRTDELVVRVHVNGTPVWAGIEDTLRRDGHGNHVCLNKNNSKINSKLGREDYTTGW